MNDSKELNFGNKIGTHTVKFPNVGQYNDIQNIRMAITNNGYGAMCIYPTKEMMISLDIIDAFSTFSILIPDFLNKLDIKNYRDLDLKTASLIRKVYRDQYFIWYKEIYDELYTEDDKKDDELMNKQDAEYEKLESKDLSGNK